MFCTVFGTTNINNSKIVTADVPNMPLKTKVSVMHLNVRSLKPHYEKLEALILSLESPPDVICLTETWLTANDDPKCYLLPGYRQFVFRNRKSTGGGVMMQLHENCVILSEKDSPFEESILSDISIHGHIYSFLTLYNKPRSNKQLFLDQLDQFLERNASHSTPMIICGDTNIDVLKNIALNKNYLNIITANGFNCFADEPTRETENTSTCLDHFIFQNLNLTRSFVLKEENISDHYPVIIEWDSCQLEKPEISFRDTSFLKNKSLHDEFLQRLGKSLSECNEKFFTEEEPGSSHF